MSTLFRVITGAISGCVATGPMTAAMILGHRRLSGGSKHVLPPREITEKVVQLSPLDSNTEVTANLTLLNHFAYGSAAGIGYALLASQARRMALPKGVLYGLLVWGFSYFGLLPGLNLLKPASHHTPPRNGLMVGAHIIWGIALSLFVKLLVEDRESKNGALAAPSVLPRRDRK